MDRQQHEPDEPAHALGGQALEEPSTAEEDAAAVDAGDDVLLQLRAQLDEVDDLPLLERAAVFERTHRVVVDELRALELG